MPRVNLVIADDVVLGKTIEAGLIARELLLRKKVREIVVSCPPSMLFLWRRLANLAAQFQDIHQGLIHHPFAGADLDR